MRPRERRQAMGCTKPGPAAGFSFVEVLVTMVILLGTMAMAFAFFVDFGRVISTESSTLATQQAARVVLDELGRNVRQAGFGVRREDPYNTASWQRALVFAGPHEIAFNADIDGAIGGIPSSETIAFPTGAAYSGEAVAASTDGAETYVYTVDADGDHVMEVADRIQPPSGSYNPASGTDNPLDFALFRRVYGYNGTDYGGATEPIMPYLFTNATSDISFPADGTTPAPLFAYWLTEDIDGDGRLSADECVNDVVDDCPPTSGLAPRGNPPWKPLLYLWGDSDFDGVLSESEKAAPLQEVGSAAWTPNPLVSGSYRSTTLASAVDPSSETAYELEVDDATQIFPGSQVQLGTGGSAEFFSVDQVVTTSSPHKVRLSGDPQNAHVVGVTVQMLPATLLRAIRTVELTFTSITDKKDSAGGSAAVGRSGRKGTGGLDYRVTVFRRRVEVINATTSAAQ